MMKTYLLLLLGIIAALGVIFAHNNPHFLRPSDDLKELLFYSTLFLTVIIGSLRVYRQRVSESITLTFIEILGISYFGYLAVNIVLSPGPNYEGWIAWGRLLLSAMGVLVLARVSSASMMPFLKLLVGVALLAVVYSFFPAHRAGDALYPIGHVSYYADFVLSVLPLSIFFGFAARRAVEKYAFFLASLIFVVALWGAATRATWLGLCASLAIVLGLWLREWRAKRLSARTSYQAIGFFLVIVITCTVIAYFWDSSFRGIGASLSNRILQFWSPDFSLDEASSGRLGMYQNTLRAVGDHWLMGLGLGSFRYLYLQYISSGSVLGPGVSWVMYPHSELLHQLFETGIFGSVLLLCLFLLILGPLFKKYVFPRNRAPEPFAIAVLSGIVAILVSVQFSTAMNHPLIRGIFVLYLASAYRWIGPSHFYHLAARISHPLRVLGLVLVLASAYLAIGNSVASYYLKTAEIELRTRKHTDRHHIAQYLSPFGFDTLYRSALYDLDMKKMESAERGLRKGIAKFPTVPLFHYKLAKLYFDAGRLEEARNLLIPINALFPTYQSTHNLLQRVENASLR